MQFASLELDKYRVCVYPAVGTAVSSAVMQREKIPEDDRGVVRMALNYSPERAYGVVNVSNAHGYFYIASLSDNFYKSAKLNLQDCDLRDDSFLMPRDDHSIIKNVSFRWIDPVSSVLDRQGIRNVAFVDVGAFVGAVTLHVASAPKSQDWSLICFEPNPENFTLLQMNLTLNGCHHAEVRQEALAAEAGTMAFSVPKGWTISGRLLKTGQADYGDRFEVKTAGVNELLDELSNRFERLVLKVDIEGFEDLVVPEIEKRFLPSIPCLLMEYWPSEDGAFEQKLIDTFRVFNIKSVQFTSELPFEELGSAEALRSWGKAQLESRSNIDIVMVPRENPTADQKELASVFSGEGRTAA